MYDTFNKVKISEMDTERNETKEQPCDKLGADDVWKDFNCPKYVSRICPKTNKLPAKIFDFIKPPETDLNYTLQKLDELILDPVTKDSSPRICRLLYQYFHQTGDNGYKIKDLPKIMRILEFLTQNVKSFKDYKPHLDQMLDLCQLPPLLDKSSEVLLNNNILEQYFTLLGHLLIVLPHKEQVLKVYKALHCLLLKRDASNVTAIKIKHCHKVVEKSELPLKVVKSLQSSLPEMYEKILELVFLLSSISYTCSHKMLKVGVLNIILVRMDLPYATQLRCTRPPDSLLTRTEYPEDTTLLIMNTLWNLMKSILPPKIVPATLKTALSCAHCALW
nr:cilia- and flagella-associated protein 69-like [Nomia melanderi]